MQFPFWVITGLLAAFFIGGQTAYQKHILNESSPLAVSFYTNVFAVPFLIAAALLFGAFTLPPTALIPLGLSIVANILGVFLIVSALKDDDVGIIGALRSFQPVVIALVEPILFASEQYALATLFAAILAVIGAYVLLVEDNPWTPIVRIRQKGPQLALASAFAYSAAILLDRYALATTEVSRTLYPLLLTAGVSVGIAALLILNGNADEIRNVTKQNITLGAFRGSVVFFGILTLSLTTGAKASILFQLSSVVSVGIGAYFFREEYIGARAIGAIILVASVALAVSGGL